MSRYSIKQLFPDEWAKLSEAAHLVVFNEKRAWDLDRIDYALVCEVEGVPQGYLTARELDQESVYWQFGGAFPDTHSTAKVAEVYQALISWSHERYKRITTLVENTNIRYLKLAMHYGFRIIGCRFFHQTILVELLNEKGGV